MECSWIDLQNPGCRKVDLAGDEIIRSVLLPWTQPLEIVRAYKQAHRRDDDIALVNACMRACCARASSSPDAPWVVQEATLAFGGVGPTVVVCKRTSEALVGRVLDHEAVQVSQLHLAQSFVLCCAQPFRHSTSLTHCVKLVKWERCCRVQQATSGLCDTTHVLHQCAAWLVPWHQIMGALWPLVSLTWRAVCRPR
jgi:CO dehydrogenase flavoprotein C-terminal domain